MYSKVFDEFINWMASHKAGDTRLVRFATGQVWVARHLERVGDHITNIAERVYFVVKGETLKNRGLLWRDGSMEFSEACSGALFCKGDAAAPF